MTYPINNYHLVLKTIQELHLPTKGNILFHFRVGAVGYISSIVVSLHKANIIYRININPKPIYKLTKFGLLLYQSNLSIKEYESIIDNLKLFYNK